MEPRMPIKRSGAVLKVCTKCGISKTRDSFISTSNWFYADGCVPVCNECIKEYLVSKNFEWSEVDKLCQNFDIPFIPREFEKMRKVNGDNVFPAYAKYFLSSEYEGLGWEIYYQKYLELQRKDKLDMELPVLRDSYYEDLKLRWGQNYDDEEVVYLENLYNGLLTSQNIVGALQMDQAQKLCKMSLTIDERIRSGLDFDKMMGSYEKLTKVADFTPKNAKSDSEFSSMGEIVAWLEKRGWINTWYDDANKDIVDEVIHSNQAFVQRLYTNENGLGEEITERIEQLKIAAALDQKDTDLEKKRLTEDPFFSLDEVDLESHDNDAYEELMIDDVLDADTAGV
jgi:hypothetical protein